MRASLCKALVTAVTAVLALGATNADAGKKRGIKRAPAPAIVRDTDGTPIIMKGYPTFGIPDIMREERRTPARVVPPLQAERPIKARRGSSTYIPSPVPSPNTPSSPPPAVLLQVPLPSNYPPPATNSFGDRVINCIHSAPLTAGVGNNPTDRQAYIRQCAN